MLVGLAVLCPFRLANAADPTFTKGKFVTVLR